MEILGKIIFGIGLGGLIGAEMYGAFQLAKTIGEFEGKTAGIIAGVFMGAIHLLILGIVIMASAS